jgi:hypothetical protein
MDFSSLLLIRLIKWEVLVFVGGLGVIVALRLLTGDINIRGLLTGSKSDGTKYFSPERVQLLVAIIALGFQYLVLVSRTPSGQMPGIPTGAMQLFGLSNAIYLGGKSWMMLRNRS